MIKEVDGPLPSVAFLQPQSGKRTINSAVRWLNRHPLWLAFLTVGYLVLTITMHDVMQRPAHWAQQELSPRGWNNLVAAVALPILCIFSLWMVLMLRWHPRVWVAAGYLVFTLTLAAICFRALLVMNIETIHFLQYAILGILLYAMAGGFGQTIVWATLFGLMDEAYQYFCLHAHWRVYLDFNDVILNTVGAAFGLVLLYASGVYENLGPSRRRRRLSLAAIITAAILVVSATAMYAGGVLRVLPEPGAQTWSIVLRRVGPTGTFWTYPSWGSGKPFHEVQPMEWLVITIVLVAIYMLLDYVRPARKLP